MASKTVSAYAVGANNTAEADISPPNGYKWQVTHIALSSPTNTIYSRATINLNQRFICGTNIGNQDSADGTPMYVFSGDTVRIIWTNVSTGAQCIAQLIVEEVGTGESF